MIRRPWSTDGNLRVLLVDDNPDDRALVHRALRRGSEQVDVTEVGTAAGFQDALSAESMAVVITDYALGWGNGLEVLHQARTRWPSCAVIMFTDSGSEEVVARAMKNGLDDYVVKSARQAEQLPAVVRRALNQRFHERRARAAEAQLSELFDRLPAGVYRVNVDNRVLYANRTLAGIMGYDAVEELIGADVGEMFVEPEEALPRRERKAEGVVTTTLQLRRRDGRVIWVRDSGRLVRDVDGTPLYFEGVIQDVTAVHEAQSEIQRQSRFVELLQEVTATANEYDTLGDTLAPALRLIRRTLNWPLAHVYGLEDGVLQPTGTWDGDGSRRFEAFRERTAETVFAEGEGLPGRALARGESVWMEDLPGTPEFIRIAPGDGSFVAGLAVPVTLRSEVLAVLEFFHTDAQDRDPALLRVLDKAGVQLGRVAERERADRRREQMESAAREAQRLDAVGRLAGGIAHDFNNLLTVIRAETDLLLVDLPESSEERESLEAIGMAADRAAGLTSQLLAFSREQPLELRAVDLNQVVDSMTRLLDRIIGDDIVVVKKLNPNLPPIHVDRNQLEQVIINMAVNARHAMPDGGTLTIASGTDTVTDDEWPDLAPGRYVLLAVEDTGHGMDAETQARIFEPFFTTKDKDRGTGLGLAMAHGVLQQSGGAIHVESAPGEGATFFLWFPPSKSAATPPVENPDQAEEPAPVAEAPAAGRVLIVEDEGNVRRLMEKALGRRGFDLEVVHDAEAALALLERDAPLAYDVLVTDHLLPGMTGLELAHRARARFSEFPVVLMSGYTEGALDGDGELPQGIRFLPKPFTVRDLVETVRAAVASAPQG